jgi:hypothetical protein
MAAIITEKFRVHNAKQFKEDFGESASSTYVFIGRPQAWSDENAPPTPANGIGQEVDSWSDMIALKKIGSADVSHGLTRYDWTSGTTYDEYAHDYSATNTSPATSADNLYDSRFYVITDEYHVYKCIRTGRDSSGAVVASDVKPTGTSATSIVETSDSNAASGRGYKWKYMFTIGASDTIKFVTNDFLPVKTLGAQTEVDGTGSGGAIGSSATDDGSAQWDVENSATDGGIFHVVVTNGGSGYTDGTYTNVPIAGDGSGATCSVVVSSGAVSYVTVSAGDEGTGYRRASIDIDNIAGIGSGSNGTVKPIISPEIGHGADPVQELGGNYVIVNSRLEFAEGSGDFPTDNDFRRIGLVQDPFTVGTTTVATASTLAAYNKMTLSTVSGISVDDIILNASSDGSGVAVGRVVSISSNDVSFLPIANSAGGYANFANSDTVYVSGSSIGTVSNVNTAFPEVQRYSGQVMYVENRGAVSRAADQIEDIKLIIEM